MTTAYRLPPPYQPKSQQSGHPLIVLEGVSGVGKSTLRHALVSRLHAVGFHTLHTPHSGWADTVNGELRPLPQFAFYLSGLFHVSDCIRAARTGGPVVSDRYVSSVVACHSAVHRVPLQAVQGLLVPYRPYLSEPTHTFYLRCSEEALRDRLAGKSDLTQDDTELLRVAGRLSRLLDNFAELASQDPRAVCLETDGQTAEELADQIVAHVESAGAESDRH
ncbi:dTMP kinase [Streptomyces sp. JW3]|uniref:dTMP kinase n=1 Tax=Streptomyces sp. JW3 TaxID=3456955 RepID=UPI003FA47278